MKLTPHLGRRLALLLALWLPLSLFAGELRIGGTGAAIGAFKQLAQEYRREHPEADIKLLPSLGSSGGIKAVLKGRLDLAISARPLKDKERAKGAASSAFARTALVFSTSSATVHGGRGFSAGEVVDLYAGRLGAWPNGQPMRPILRPLNDSDSTLLMDEIPGMEEALVAAHDRRGAVVSFTDQSAMDDTQRLVGTVGTATLCAILGEQRSLHVFAIDGVTPSNASIASGEYPYVKTLHFVTRGAPNAEIRRFVDFVHSPAMAERLATLGLLSVR